MRVRMDLRLDGGLCQFDGGFCTRLDVRLDALPDASRCDVIALCHHRAKFRTSFALTMAVAISSLVTRLAMA